MKGLKQPFLLKLTALF